MDSPRQEVNKIALDRRRYKCLPFTEFGNQDYKLVPIRDSDKYLIMEWRNEQIEILRQDKRLTKGDQETYFATVVAKLFEKDFPGQLLFSVLEKDALVGYGGLVHIDWTNMHAEISFLTATARNREKDQVIDDWKRFLKIIREISSLYLNFVKIYTYAFDVRPFLYQAFTDSNFIEEARLKKHVIISGRAYDVLIHSCFLDHLFFRMANDGDLMLYLDWANDPEVRKNSYNPSLIELENHKKWFLERVRSSTCFMYLFYTLMDEPVGQVRIEELEDEVVIGISLDKMFRQKGLSAKMLLQSTGHFLKQNPDKEVVAYIKVDNKSSYKSFVKAGFTVHDRLKIEGSDSYKLKKKI